MANETEWPRAKYELTERAYIAPTPDATPRLMEKGQVVEIQGKPGPHMVPTCAAGEEAKRRAGEQQLDPTRFLNMRADPTGDDLAAALLRKLTQMDGLVPTLQLPGVPRAAAPTKAPPPPPPAPPPPK